MREYLKLLSCFIKALFYRHGNCDCDCREELASRYEHI